MLALSHPQRCRKKLTALLSETKPYWLADQFTAFHEPQNIAQARYLLGENPSQKQQDKVENPLFSIIVPIYNVERYLEQCIESVLAQDYQNYELILVDDGSPDNSIDICVKYAKQYSNIVLSIKLTVEYPTQEMQAFKLLEESI